jgi:hypothetical protein
MSDLQRASAKEENLNALVGGFTPDMNDTDKYNALLRGGHFAEAKAFNESAAKANADKRAAESARLDNLTKVHGIFKTTMNGIIGNPTLANAINTVRKTGKLLGEDTADDEAELMAFGENPTAIRQWATNHALEADKLLAKPTERATNTYKELTDTNPASSTYGQVIPGSRIEMGVSPNTTATINAAAEQGRLNREARADKPKPLTAKQDTDLQHNIGKDRRTALDAIASFGEVKLATQSVREIPKSTLENVAGWTGYLPSISDASQSADTALNNLKGKVTSLGKIAASAGGAIGTMAVQEWTIIRDMIAALDEKSMTPADIKNQMDLIDAHVAGAEERLREAYQTTHQEDFVRYPNRFELPAAGTTAPPPPPKVTPTAEDIKQFNALKARKDKAK